MHMEGIETGLLPAANRHLTRAHRPLPAEAETVWMQLDQTHGYDAAILLGVSTNESVTSIECLQVIG